MTLETALTAAVTAEAVAIGVMWRELLKLRKALASAEDRRAEAWEEVARRYMPDGDDHA